MSRRFALLALAAMCFVGAWGWWSTWTADRDYRLSLAVERDEMIVSDELSAITDQMVGVSYAEAHALYLEGEALRARAHDALVKAEQRLRALRRGESVPPLERPSPEQIVASEEALAIAAEPGPVLPCLMLALCGFIALVVGIAVGGNRSVPAGLNKDTA